MLRQYCLSLAGALIRLRRPFSRADRQPLLLSARDSAEGQHAAVGYCLNGREVFTTVVNQRCHDVIEHPTYPVALFVGRRPGNESYLIDLRDGSLLQTVYAPAGRHFYGHAVIHRQGEWLYATENDTTRPGRGVLGIYRFNGPHLSRQGEISTHGIGPHEVAWMPDGETLVVANGGIRTEAESRVEMNLQAMESSLVLMTREGSLLSHDTLSQPMNSIRHLAVARDGTILTSQQYMGDSHEIAPLLAIKRPGQRLQPFAATVGQLASMHQYTASVAVHDDLRLIALTAPRGNRVFIWDLNNGQLRLESAMPDCAGVAAVKSGFVVTSGQGRCRLYDARKKSITAQPLSLPGAYWDNHLRRPDQTFDRLP